MPAEKVARNAEVVKAYLNGSTLHQVGQQFGISFHRVRQIVQTWFKKHPMDADQARRTALLELDEVAATLYQQLHAGSVKAAALLIKLIAERARIAGVASVLDLKHSPLSWSTPDAQLAALKNHVNEATDSPGPGTPGLPAVPVGETPPADSPTSP